MTTHCFLPRSGRPTFSKSRLPYYLRSVSTAVFSKHYADTSLPAPASSSVQLFQCFSRFFPADELPLDNETSHCSELIRLQLIVYTRRRSHELQSLSKRLLREGEEVVRNVKCTISCLYKRSGPCQNHITLRSDFCYSVSPELCTQPVLLH